MSFSQINVNFYCLEAKRINAFFGEEKWLVITDKDQSEVKEFYSHEYRIRNLYPTDKFNVKLEVDNLKREVKFLFY